MADDYGDLKQPKRVFLDVANSFHSENDLDFDGKADIDDLDYKLKQDRTKYGSKTRKIRKPSKGKNNKKTDKDNKKKLKEAETDNENTDKTSAITTTATTEKTTTIQTVVNTSAFKDIVTQPSRRTRRDTPYPRTFPSQRRSRPSWRPGWNTSRRFWRTTTLVPSTVDPSLSAGPEPDWLNPLAAVACSLFIIAVLLLIFMGIRRFYHSCRIRHSELENEMYTTYKRSKTLDSRPPLPEPRNPLPPEVNRPAETRDSCVYATIEAEERAALMPLVDQSRDIGCPVTGQPEYLEFQPIEEYDYIVSTPTINVREVDITYDEVETCRDDT